ncbi:MAG: SnoaL-like domain-containing protein [Syntrophaceae bacterium]|nr:SnoaL-like domain-containing protein [Syntrophaceae bacterium]
MKATPTTWRFGLLFTSLSAFLIVTAAFLYGPPAAGAANASSRAVEEAMITFDQFIDLYIKKDLKGIMALHDADVTAIGTNRDEQFIGREALGRAYARDFARIDRIKSIGWSVLSSGAQGSVVWVAADLRISCVIGGAPQSVGGRLTTVLRKKSKSWQIVQTHYSLPADRIVRMDALVTFGQIDVNDDGKISFEEIKIWVRDVTPESFRNADRNGDGYLNREEYELLRKK